MRRLIAFPCAGETLLGSLDEAAGTTGLLIVSGGNEVRAGAHRGMALLAARLAESGIPVFRHDRRGVGDSTGENTGFEGARDDLVAAAAAFREAAPHVMRVIGFGNCDGATTLARWGREAGIDAVLLANPWVVAGDGDLPPPAAIRAHYARRLLDPRTVGRLLTGRISFRSLFRGLRALSQTPPEDSLGALEAVASWRGDATIILAETDNTAIAYADAARRAGLAPRTVTISTASHSFARAEDAAALEAAIRDAISARG